MAELLKAKNGKFHHKFMDNKINHFISLHRHFQLNLCRDLCKKKRTSKHFKYTFKYYK